MVKILGERNNELRFSTPHELKKKTSLNFGAKINPILVPN